MDLLPKKPCIELLIVVVKKLCKPTQSEEIYSTYRVPTTDKLKYEFIYFVSAIYYVNILKRPTYAIHLVLTPKEQKLYLLHRAYFEIASMCHVCRAYPKRFKNITWG